MIIPKPGNKKVVYINDRDKFLEELPEKLKKGEIKNAIIVYNENGNPHYKTLSSSNYPVIGWLLFQAMQALFLEESGI